MSSLSFKMSISPDGTASLIYDDMHADFIAEGRATIARASHVEPQGAEWIADMSPVGGSVLGPFRLRSEALAAEHEYLEQLMF